MISLVLTLCVTGLPDACTTRSYPLYEASLLTCIMQGQQEIPKLIAARPGVYVKEWKCE